MSGDGQPDFAVPADADPATCSYCGEPYRTETQLALHRGLAHAPDLTGAEREAFEAARAEEADELGKFRVKALGVLVLLYFGLLMTYAVV